MDETSQNIPTKGRIFIVEDETIVAEDLRERLQKHGYDIVGAATSGSQAIDLIQKVRPDIVIMDVLIKGELDGIEVATIIQKHFDHPIPIIFLTGFSEQVYRHIKVVEYYLFINKPFENDTLLEAVERALEKSSRR